MLKIALKWIQKQMIARGRPKKNWMEGIRKAMNERNLNEGQWEDRKRWSLGVGQRRRISQMKLQLDATLCRFNFCRVTLHVSGASAHHQDI